MSHLGPPNSIITGSSPLNNSNTSTTEDLLYGIAANLLNTPGLPLLLFVIILLSVIAVFLNIILAYVIFKVSIFHPSLRLLLAHISFLCAWYCVTISVKASYIVDAYVREDPSSLIMDGYSCKLQEIARTWPSQSLIYASIAVTLERLYSTWRYNKEAYNSASRPWLAVLLIPLVYINPLVNIAKSFSGGLNSRVPVCDSTLTSSYDSVLSSLLLNLSFAIVSVLLVGVLQYVNHTKLRWLLANRALTHTLAARFQLEQNIQITRMLIPSAALEFVTILPAQVLSVWLAVGPVSYDTKVLMIQAQYLWKIIFCVGYPLLTLAKNTHVQKAFVKSMPRWLKRRLICRCGTKVDASIGRTPEGVAAAARRMKAADRTHFEILNSMWSSKPKR